MFGRRIGIATTVAGAAFACAVGLSGPASAATVLFQNDNVNVKVSGGEVAALNSCIADAQDGVIQNQLVVCRQISTGGNLVSLDGVSVWVTSAAVPHSLLYHGDKVTASVTGGLATAFNECVADAYDGVIQTQEVACDQVASAGKPG